MTKEVANMKQNNVIDMRSYFESVRQEAVSNEKNTAAKAEWLCRAQRYFENAATVVITVCMGVCTLLFFTLL